jgi:hypothetical protein
VDGKPGEEKKLFGYTQDQCPEYGCLLEVREDAGENGSGKMEGRVGVPRGYTPHA